MAWLQRILDRLTRESRYPSGSRVPATPRTLAGVMITADSAVTVPTVWACLRYLSQTVAMLPWRVMREIDGGGEIAPGHPVDRLLYVRASPEWSPLQFRETMTHWALRWGNGYAEIERDGIGRPQALWPLHPERVQVLRDTETGGLYYEVNNALGGNVQLDPRDVFHIRGFGEGPVGVNVISYAAQSIGWVRAAQLYGAAFFGNGMNPAGVVQNKLKLSPEALEYQRAEFDRLYGGPRNAHRTLVLDGESEWKPIGFNARDSQLVEVHQHLVEDICRWFGVPPHKVMHLLRSTNNNIEHQSIEVVQDAVLPWVKRFEEEADYKLFGPENRRGYYTKINLMGLLRGDFKSQAEGFRIYREMGVVNGNEIRERIDFNPMAGEGGDKYTMQSQYTTLERIGEDDPEPAPAAMPENAAQDDADALATAERVLATLDEPVA